MSQHSKHAQETLEGLYNFVQEEHDNLEKEWKQFSDITKLEMPLALFIIGVYSCMIEKVKSEDGTIQ
jgi:hypothetical protein